MPVRSLVSGLVAALIAGLTVVLTPTVAQADTTLCTGRSFSETAVCDPGWAVNMTFMHWRMYAGQNCTNYVAWRLGVNGVPQPNYLLGNASNWASRAASHGVPVNSTPAVGAVGVLPGRNHIVYIDEVRADSLVISESSYSQRRYRKYVAVPGERTYPTQFIHFSGTPGQVTISGPTPVVSGTAAVGAILSATAGTWTPTGVVLAYQWLREGSIIGGATAPTYRPTAADVGLRITVSITGSSTGLPSRTAVSAPTVPVTGGPVTGEPITPGTPAIVGAAVAGTVLRVNVGNWTPAGLQYSYHWYANSKRVSTRRKLKLTAAHRGKVITVQVTGTAPGTAPVKAVSAPTLPVARRGTPPPSPAPSTPARSVSPGVPTITGTTRMMVGDVLTANVGTWSPAGVTTAIQWVRNGVAIPGATSSTYTLAKDDLGKPIRIDVTGTRVNRAGTRASSAATPPVVARQLTAVVPPAITGTPVVGGTLTVSPGSWSPTGAITAIQWARNGQLIPGATGATYRPSAADHRWVIGAVVTATVPGVPPDARAVVSSGPVQAVPVVRATVTPVPQKHGAVLTIRVDGLGVPVAGTVAIAEGGRALGSTRVDANGGLYFFSGPRGVHQVQLAFGGADGYTAATAQILVETK